MRNYRRVVTGINWFRNGRGNSWWKIEAQLARCATILNETHTHTALLQLSHTEFFN